MQLLPSLVIVSVLSSLGHCQFFYNYEQAEPEGYQTESNSPMEVNEPDKKEIRTVPERPQIASTQPVTSETQDVQPQRPRIRRYRRILRQGEYIQPPQPPIVHRPSIFENIRLGEAPNGVYIPQDSLLNVLKNPRYNNEIPQYQAPQSAPLYNSYQGPNLRSKEPEYKFFVEPPQSYQPRLQQNTLSNAVQPNVQYASNYPVNTSPQVRSDESTQNLPPRREAQVNKIVQRRRPTPEVDIDALRTIPDVMPYEVPNAAPEIQPVTQPRSVSRNARRRTRVQIYDEPTQPPKVYEPSVFQNIGLGEAPEGVYIPEDSLLNILRNPSRTQPRYSSPDLQPSSQTQTGADMSPQNYLQPATAEATEPPRASRRQSRQRARASRTSSVRNTEPQLHFPTNDEDQEFLRTVPASSQNQHRRQTKNEDSAVNRRQRANESQPRQSSRRQQHVQPKQSEAEPSRYQQSNRNFKPAKLALAALPEDTDGDEIPGEATIDYPIFHSIPRTSFSCTEQDYNGYYADMETTCQVVHLCQDGGVQSSFLCPNGTIFNQEKLSCQWWYKVNCANSPKFYIINSNLYKTPEVDESKRNEST